ncbi:MAG: T9SS type A sorting domain-containing protein [Bacteroidetes bacterium]|nr:T9SS type A sorting domain-containing protein [Bacteroidota bacterium]
MSGVYNIPGSYPSILNAIIDLNNLGVSGPVTVNIAAGYTETAPPGGFQLYVSGTSVTPVIIQKSGIGNNPIITSHTTGIGTPTTMTQDGIWRLMGCDYVTIDGIDLVDQNTTNPATMEFGFGFFNAPSGCQYNTIKNCHINLKTINNVLGSGMAGDGSRGIEITNAWYNSHLWSSNPSTFSETHSYNKFYNNIIENCNVGISFKGAWTNTISNACQFNDIGGLTTATGNTIINFGGVTTATTEAVGIRVENIWETNISNNIINNNNGSGADHPAVLRGIYSFNYSDANTSINSNTVSLKDNGNFFSAPTAIENAQGSTFNGAGSIIINGNSIINCTQSNTNSNLFRGVANLGSASNLTINNNLFNNISMASNYSIGNAMIINTGNISNNLNINNNTISNINLTASVTSSDFQAISNQTGTLSTLSISGNSLHSVNYSGTGSGEFHFIHTNCSPTVSFFNNNNCSNVTVHTNSLVNCMYINGTGATVTVNGNIISNFSKAVAGNYLYGIYALSPNAPGIVTVSNNTISGVHTKNNTIFNAIQVLNGNASTINSRKYIINGNNINNITGDTISSSVGINGSVSGAGSSIHDNHIFNFTGCSSQGIVLGFNGTNISVHSNTIHAFKQTNQAQGIVILYAKDVNVYKNRIFDLEAGNNGFVYGLSVSSGTGVTNVHNNLVADLRTPSATGGGVCGFVLGTAFFSSTLTACYNTIYLNAISTSSNFSATGIKYASTPISNPNAPLIKLHNNIVVNNSTVPGPFQKNLGLEDTTPFSSSNTGVLSNNNLLYAGLTSTNNEIMNGFATLAAAQNALWPRESSSAEELPTFANLNGLHPAFLQLSNSIPTQAESGGAVIPWVTDDHGGTIRNTSTPDIGAWEGNYPLADSVAPSISNINITSGSCNLSSITLTANIIDASGVASGSVSPRCYYKINSGPYLSNPGTLISGTGNNGNWQFLISYTANPGDLLTYYFVAQDISLLQNVGASPSVSFTAANVNSVITAPASEYTLNITGVLNGTYLVGAAGNFTTLTDAAQAYNTWCITGPATFILTDANYSTSETFPVTFKKNPDASNTNSLLIKPSTGNNVTIVTSTTTATLKFLDANYIDLDGLNVNGSSLNIINSYFNISMGIWLANTSSLTVGCKRIAIKNCRVESASSTTNNYCIFSSENFFYPAFQDSITIQNNTLEKAFNAIRAQGNGISLKEWSISENTIGPAFSGPNDIGGHAIFIAGFSNFTISKNNIRNIHTTLADVYAIYFSTGNNLSVINNTISSISSSAMSSGIQSIAGIKLEGTNNNVLIEKNNITGISNNSTFGDYSARGITIDGGGTGNRIKNNFISNIFSGGGLGGQLMPAGMGIENCYGYDIDNNTINLASTYYGYVGPMESSALYINANTTNIRLRNNILSNTYDNNNSPLDVAYSIYSDAPATCFTAIDNNNYYVGGPTSTLVLGYINSANQTNLSAFQSSFGSNLNSKNVLPVFTSSVDLHLVATSNPSLDNSGTPSTSVITDIDNQPRSITTPDIGADEFFNFACSSVVSATQNITAYNLCNGQTAALSATGGAGNGIVYQWQVSTSPGGPYTNVSGGQGATTSSYTTGLLNTGNYYFVLKTTCAISSLSSISNESTLTINPIPTVSLTNNTPVCVGQNLILNGNSNIATQFNWIGPNSFSASVQNPTINSVAALNAGIYTLSVSQNSCTNSSTVNIVLTTPTIAATNAGPYCVGNNIQLNTYTAMGYSWTGPLSFTSNLQNPIINAATTNISGTYTLIANLGACIATATTNISVNNAPSAPTINYNGPLCVGSNLILNSNGNSNLYFSWNGANSFYSSLQSPTIANVPASATGIYSLILIDANNCSSATSTFSVIINPGPLVTINTSSNFICAGQNVTLTAQGAVTYTWSNGSNNSSVILTPTLTSTYSVTGTSTIGCNTTIPQLISVGTSPTISIISSSNTICSGNNVTLNATGAANYTWSTGSNNSQIIVNPLVNTTYTLIGTSLSGCISNTTQVITTIPLPTISITSSNSLICIGSNAVLTASGAVNYTWSTGSYNSQITVSPTMNWIYNLTGVDNNGCINYANYLQNVTVCVDIEKNSLFSTIEIYPNPNNGEFYIDLPQNSVGGSVEIFNSVNQLIKYTKIETQLQKINIHEFAKGFYIVKIKNKNMILTTKKVIKD